MMLVAVLAFLAGPYLLVLVVVRAVDHFRALRDERYARQIAVTDAIHREIGPIVAPVVEKSAWGPWRLRIAVPFDRPALVCRIVDVAQQSLEALRTEPCEIVLLPQAR
jgi:hypothetical protein